MRHALIAVVAGCAAGGAGSAAVAVAAGSGDDAGGGWRALDCWECESNSFCFDLAEPAPIAAWFQVNGGDGWVLVPDPFFVGSVTLADGGVVVSVQAKQDVTGCRAWAWL